MKLQWIAIGCLAALLLVPPARGGPKKKAAPVGKQEPGKSETEKRHPELYRVSSALLDHLKALFKIIKDNMDDCDRAVNTVHGYVAELKGELHRLVRRGKELEKALGPADKKVFDREMSQRVQPLIEEITGSVQHFMEKCPEHMNKFVEALGFLSEQPEPEKPPAAPVAPERGGK